MGNTATWNPDPGTLAPIQPAWNPDPSTLAPANVGAQTPASPTDVITPLPGESFADTMKRGIAAAKALTPEQRAAYMTQFWKDAPRNVAIVLGSSVLAGPALLGAGVMAPEAAFTAAGGGVLGSAAAGATAGAGQEIINKGLHAAGGENVLTAKSAGDVGKAALAGGAVGGALGLAGKGIEYLRGLGEEEEPGIVQQVLKGKEVAQPQAQSALRGGVEAGAKEGGVSIQQPASLRTVVEEPIDKIDAEAKALYRQIDQASGTDFKALNSRLSNVEYQMRILPETEDMPEVTGKLEEQRQAIIGKIETAKQQAIDAGVDPKILGQADAKFKQARALSDLETKVFKNPSIVRGNAAFKTPETVNVDSAIKQLQKLQDKTQYGGSRLEQALGKDGARNLLDNFYEAQRSGVKALQRQEVAKWIARVMGIGAGAKIGYEVLKGD